MCIHPTRSSSGGQRYQGGPMMDLRLELMPEDWERMLAIVAHPDDLEYGAASAIARWTRAGKSVGYVVVTNGDAGIDGLPPREAGPIRVAETTDQRPHRRRRRGDISGLPGRRRRKRWRTAARPRP
jgi:LmbE family N-acetylglucosaminyl deacetylase